MQSFTKKINVEDENNFQKALMILKKTYE